MQFFSYSGSSQAFKGTPDMASAMLSTRSRPKRKRAQVSYYEGTSGESDADASGSSVGDWPSRKKLKPGSQAASRKPLPKRKVFPFSSLPAELKNTIYTYALTDPNGVFLASKLKRYRRTVRRVLPGSLTTNDYGGYRRYGHGLPLRPASDSDSDSAAITLRAFIPNLLALNHQIYDEAQPILYRSNAFVLEDTTALHNFLANIGPRNAAALAEVTIKGWGYSKMHKALNHPAFTLLASAVNLRRLHLDCRISWYSSPQRIAMQVYRDAFHWLEAVGSATGRWDAALDVIEVMQDNFATNRYGMINSEVPKPSHEEQMAIFQDELRKLLR